MEKKRFYNNKSILKALKSIELSLQKLIFIKFFLYFPSKFSHRNIIVGKNTLYIKSFVDLNFNFVEFLNHILINQRKLEILCKCYFSYLLFLMSKIFKEELF